MTGFISLSQEVLWVRLFGFVNHSIPQAFSFVLLFYLFGIAIGARIGKEICLSSCNLWRISGIILILASLFDLICPWLYAESFHTQWQLTVGGALVLLTALSKAIIFPIAHQLGTPDDSHIGQAVSRVYVSNILGATLGPVITSIVLLNFFSTQQCYMVVAILTFLVGIYCAGKQKWILGFGAALVVVSICSFIAKHEPSFLMVKAAAPVGQIKKIIETKQGIITLYQGPKADDLVFGGNVYDGRVNLDPLHNSNGIDRILILSALHEKPEHVLMIGLSIGTWLKLITSFPSIKDIDVVEINPGYLKAINEYRPQQSALLDPRVHIHIDDGRRWLKIHAAKKYDLIVMNTTYHWRAYSSSLLSQEFLTLVKQHMRENAVLAFNATGSGDAFNTAAHVFSHAYLYKNFVVASDFDWREKLHGLKAVKHLSQLHLDNKFLFPLGSEERIKQFLFRPIQTLQQAEQQAGRPLEIITDNNLLPEYKYGAM